MRFRGVWKCLKIIVLRIMLDFFFLNKRNMDP